MSKKKWTIKDLLQVTSDYLSEKEIDSPRLCSEILLAHLLNTTRVKLYLAYDRPLNDNEVDQYRSLIKRRLKREPLQYITGIQEFWSMEFNVGNQALIPRPETELLVEHVVSMFADQDSPDSKGLRLLDLGTGSGVIGISIAKELTSSIVWASDLSNKALDLARLNANKLDVIDRMNFVQGDMFQPFKDHKPKFNAIVSNPPYISSEEYDDLAPEIRNFEPRSALDGHENGLFYIERIIQEAGDYLLPGGVLLIEMDPRQTSRAARMLEEKNLYPEIGRIKDYHNRYRVVMAKKTR